MHMGGANFLVNFLSVRVVRPAVNTGLRERAVRPFRTTGKVQGGP